MTVHHPVRLPLIIASAAVVLGLASTVGVAAVLDGTRNPLAPRLSACSTPSLAGFVVDVTLADMGGMMGPGMMGPGMMGNGPANNGYPWQDAYPWPRMGMMRLYGVPNTVPAGTMSLRVHNNGGLTHEVVVLPLGPGQRPGQRAIGVDGKVDETGSLGEASRTCAADQGEGIGAGANAWTTINLPPGRYELLCNIAGHYADGMYGELDTTERG